MDTDDDELSSQDSEVSSPSQYDTDEPSHESQLVYYRNRITHSIKAPPIYTKYKPPSRPNSEVESIPSCSDDEEEDGYRETIPTTKGICEEHFDPDENDQVIPLIMYPWYQPGDDKPAQQPLPVQKVKCETKCRAEHCEFSIPHVCKLNAVQKSERMNKEEELYLSPNQKYTCSYCYFEHIHVQCIATHTCNTCNFSMPYHIPSDSAKLEEMSRNVIFSHDCDEYTA